MRVSFFLDKPKAEYSSIFIRVGYGKQYLRYYPNITIPTEYWNKKAQQAKQTVKFAQHPEFNRRLTDIAATIENIFNRYKTENNSLDPTPPMLKMLLDAALKPSPIEAPIRQETFILYFEQFIDRSIKGNRIRKGKASQGTVYNTNKGYITTYKHLKAFGEKWKRKLDWPNIDLEFYNDYTSYLANEAQLSTNTIGDHIKRIKAVLYDAQANEGKLGIKVNQAFTSPYFNRISEPADSIYLTDIELREIEKLDLSANKRLEAVRDMFLIGCYTGQRYSDWNKITPDVVKAGIIEITQQKTETKIAIPVHPTVNSIFDKYNGSLPKLLSNQKFNEALKEVTRLVPNLQNKESKTITKAGTKRTNTYPKWQLVSSHTARRTFATLQYLAGMPTISIMAVTGHKTEQSFLNYIKLTKKEHAQLMLKLWEERKAPIVQLKAS